MPCYSALRRRIQRIEVAVKGTDLSLDRLAVCDLSDAQIVDVLPIQPRLCIPTKASREWQRGVCRDSTSPAHDVVDAWSRNVQRLGQSVNAHASGAQEVLAQNFARMHWPHAVFDTHAH